MSLGCVPACSPWYLLEAGLCSKACEEPEQPGNHPVAIYIQRKFQAGLKGEEISEFT